MKFNCFFPVYICEGCGHQYAVAPNTPKNCPKCGHLPSE